MLGLLTRLELSESEQRLLLDAAHACITKGFETHNCSQPFVDNYPCRLHQAQSSFVSLHVAGALRGCAGSVEPKTALLLDVCRNAYDAAFQDCESLLEQSELTDLSIHVSVLGPMTRLNTASFSETIGQLQPGIDGVFLRKGIDDATSLPDVWASIPEPSDFLRDLFSKAGLEVDDWSPGIEICTYQTQSFSSSGRAERRKGSSQAELQDRTKPR